MIMNFFVIGSCIGGDIVTQAKNPNWKIKKNYVSISPFAIVKSVDEKHNDFDSSIFNEERSPQNLIDDINGEIIENIRKEFYAENDNNILLVDLGDFRINAITVTIENGLEISFTNRNYSEDKLLKIYNAIEKKYNSKIIKKEELNIRDLSNEELSLYISK